MNSFRSAIFLLSVAVCLITADSLVRIHDHNVLSSVTTKNEWVLVFFFSDGCTKCDHIFKYLPEVATELRHNDPPIVVAGANIDTDNMLSVVSGVEQTPDWRVFHNGDIVHRPFGAKLSLPGIVSYMRRFVSGAVTPVSTVEEASVYTSKEGRTAEAVVMNCFLEDHAGSKSFEYAAEMYKDFAWIKFITATQQLLREHYGCTSVVVFNHDTHNTSTWHPASTDEARMSGDLLVFIAKFGRPLIGIANLSTVAFFRASSQPVFQLFYNTDETLNGREIDFVRKKLRPVAEAHPHLTFTIVDHSLRKESEQYHFPDDKSIGRAPFGITFQVSKWRPATFQEGFSVDAVTNFVDQWHEGKLEPYRKSGPVPKDNFSPGSGSVIEVVALTFTEHVTKSTEADVLLVVYAPWCGHCKEIMPILDEVAKLYKGDKGMIVAKIDATANELPHAFTATSYPTIFFVHRHAKHSPEMYGGERTLAAFRRFIDDRRPH